MNHPKCTVNIGLRIVKFPYADLLLILDWQYVDALHLNYIHKEKIYWYADHDCGTATTSAIFQFMLNGLNRWEKRDSKIHQYSNICVKEAVYAHQYVFNIMPSQCLDGNRSSIYFYLSRFFIFHNDERKDWQPNYRHVLSQVVGWCNVIKYFFENI